MLSAKRPDGCTAQNGQEWRRAGASLECKHDRLSLSERLRAVADNNRMEFRYSRRWDGISFEDAVRTRYAQIEAVGP